MGRGTGFCKRDSPRSITLGSAAAPTITRVTKKEKSIQYFVTRRVVRIVTSDPSRGHGARSRHASTRGEYLGRVPSQWLQGPGTSNVEMLVFESVNDRNTMAPPEELGAGT